MPYKGGECERQGTRPSSKESFLTRIEALVNLRCFLGGNVSEILFSQTRKMLLTSPALARVKHKFL